MTSGMAHVGQGCGTECRLGEGQNGWMLHLLISSKDGGGVNVRVL